MPAPRRFGVRRLAATFTVDTVAPHESLERDGLHRKSGSKLPHSKAPQEHRPFEDPLEDRGRQGEQECLCYKARVTGHETRVTRSSSGRGR